MRFISPFCVITLLGAALVLLPPASIMPARAPAAQAAQQSMPSDGTKSDSSKASATQTTGMSNVAAAVQANPRESRRGLCEPEYPSGFVGMNPKDR